LKVVSHHRYRRVYSSDPVSALGGMESIYGELRGVFEFAEPETAHEKLYCLFTAKTTLIRYYLAGNNDCRIL